VHGPWPDWLGHRIQAGEPRSGGRLAHSTRVLHGLTCWGMDVPLLPGSLTVCCQVLRSRVGSPLYVIGPSWCWLSFAGSRSWMPGRRPWRVDRTDDSTASDVAVVMVSLFGHVDGEEWVVGDPGGGSSQIAFRRLNSGMAAVRDLWGGAKVFLGESLALRRQRWRCMWLS
jgi:hypothetical protein